MASGKLRRLCLWTAILLTQGAPRCFAQAKTGSSMSSWETEHYASCLSSTTFENLKNKQLIGEATPKAIADVFLCRALTGQNPRLCDKVEVWLHDKSAVQPCADLYADLRAIIAAMRRDPQAVSLCQKTLPREASASFTKKVCEDYIQTLRTGRYDAAFCERVVRAAAAARIEPAFSVDDCRKEYAFFEGPKACESAGDSFRQNRCREKAFFLKALSAGNDWAACGASTLCASAMNSAGSCSAVSQMAVESHCRAETRERFRGILAVDKKLRQESGLPAYKPGDPLTTHEFSAGLKREKQLRKENGLPPYKSGDPLLPDSFWTGLKREKKFRLENDLPPYKSGDVFLNDLPSDQRIRHEKNPRKSAEEKAGRRASKQKQEQENQDSGQ